MEAALPCARPDPAPERLPFERRLEGAMPELARFAARLEGADGDDLTQEVLAKALRGRASFDPSRPILPWLKRIAMRLAIDRARRRADQAGPLASEPPGDHGGVHAFERREELARWLALLEEPERNCLVGFHVEGRSIAELARRLGLPQGTVKSHLHRARRKLVERTRGGEG